MKLSEGFSKLLPSISIFIFYGISFTFLTLALKVLPVGMTYAIWAGAGTALITLVGIIWFGEIVQHDKSNLASVDYNRRRRTSREPGIFALAYVRTALSKSRRQSRHECHLRQSGVNWICRYSVNLFLRLAELRNRGVEALLVSSGAVGAGRSIVKLSDDLSPVAARQVLSSTGQIRLINTYADLFEQHGLKTAQILVTKSDFRDRLHYLNIRTCLASLLEHRIIPVINENDAGFRN